MSDQISYMITAALGCRLPFHCDASLTYDETNPNKFENVAVAMVGDGRVKLATGTDKIVGQLIKLEWPDTVSTKATIALGPVLWFRCTTAPATADFGVNGVVPDANGNVKAGAGGLGRIISYDSAKQLVYVSTY